MRIGVFLLVAGVVLGSRLPARAADAKGDTVVFVCEHGTVKSVIAALWFNKLAEERGLKTRAISRGVAPDAAVPEVIAAALQADGLSVAGFTPAALTRADLEGAARVVAIGVDVRSILDRAAVPLESWPDIPPATRDYAAARDAMVARIAASLAEGRR